MRRWPRVVALLVEGALVVMALALLLLWCSVPSTAALATQNPTTTAFIDLRRDQAAAAGRPFELQWQWRPLGKISRYLRAAVVYAEDWNFYEHDGIDWDAIESALETNLEKGSLAIGGSTITQQLAKNLYLSPSRSLIRKVRELLIAYRLEDTLGKQRILELYLNVVEWGDGVFGAEAAARHWYGKSAQALTPAEAVRLAIALPNPFKRAPKVRSRELTKKAVRLIRILRVQGLIDEAQERAALDAVGAPDAKTLPTRRRAADEAPPTPADDVAAPSPDVTAPRPDVTAPSPDVTTPRPDAAAATPDVTAPRPDVTAPDDVDGRDAPVTSPDEVSP